MLEEMAQDYSFLRLYVGNLSRERLAGFSPVVCVMILRQLKTGSVLRRVFRPFPTVHATNVVKVQTAFDADR